MTKKAKRIKLARHLRRFCPLTLPESIKAAKYLMALNYLAYPPKGIVVCLEAMCCEGCCYGHVPYVLLKSGGLRAWALLEPTLPAVLVD